MSRFELRQLTAEDDPQAKALHDRLVAGGFSGPTIESTRAPFPTLQIRQGAPIQVQTFGAFLDGALRGGVIIKRLPFRLLGRRVEQVGYYKYPLSEGTVDARFVMLGSMIQRTVSRQFPLLYGMGATLESAAARMMVATRWAHMPLPFHVAVFDASSLLRTARPLQRNARIGAVARTLAATPFPKLGLDAAHLAHRISRRGEQLSWRITTFEDWDDWADQLWTAGRDEYALAGLRDRAVLASLYPPEVPQFHKFQVWDGTRLAGWAVISVAQLDNHNHFGDACLGTVIDAFARPEDAPRVAAAAVARCRDLGADLAVVNHGDDRWNAAFRKLGMIAVSTNCYLYLAPALRRELSPLDEQVGRFFFMRGDGDGPTNLW